MEKETKLLKIKLAKNALAIGLALSFSISVSKQSFAQDTPPVLKPIVSDTCSSDQKKALLHAHGNFAKMLDFAPEGASEETDSVEWL